MYRILQIIFVLFLAVIYGCDNSEKQNIHKLPEIPVVKAIKADMPIYNEFVGQMYGVKDIPIPARVEGFLLSIKFKEGQRVKKGQLLYVIDPQQQEAVYNSQHSKVTEAKTILQKAKSDLNRIRPLAAANAVSQSDLDAAQAAYDAALASLKSAEANLRSASIKLSYTKIYSPINGIIGKTNARVGEFVGREPNPVILNTVSQIDTIIVKFFLTESEFLRISKSFLKNKNETGETNDYSVPVQLELSDNSIYEHNGKIDFVDRNVNTSTGSIMIQASFKNPDKLLRPGMYCKVKVRTDLLKNAIVIPHRCLVELQGEYSVFVVNDSNQIQSKIIEVSDIIGDLAIVSSGINPGDRVVIDALQKVSSGMLIQPVITVFKSIVLNNKKNTDG